MQMTVKDRIRFVLKERNTSVYQLAEGETARVKLHRQINGDTQLSEATVSLVLSKLPDISADWLLRGEGPMERTKIFTPASHHQDIHVSEGGKASITQSGVAHLVVNDEPLGNETFTALLEEKDKQIAELEHNIAILKETIRILSSK